MKIICTLIALCSYCLLHAQKAGTLDSSFGVNGKVLTSSATGYLDCVGGGLQSDGSIIAAGDVSFVGASAEGFFAARYSSNGLFDTSFGKKGFAFINGTGYAEAIAIQKDNKIIIAGYNTDLFGTYYIIIASRFNADGSVDTTFGKNGSIQTHAGENCHGIAIQPDGKILFVGRNKDSIVTLRYFPDGTPDESFGNNGSVATTFGSNEYAGSSVAIQSDGKIIIAGYGGGAIVLARYNSDGTYDTEFGNNGKVISDITSGFDGVNHIVLQPDGKIVAVGASSTGNFPDTTNTVVLRYMPDGSLDKSFGNNGFNIYQLQTNAELISVVLQANDKIIVAGYEDDSTGINAHFLVERYNTNGIIDSSFGNNGYQLTEMDQSDVAETAMLQPGGKIVLAGAAYNNQTGPSQYEVALARYNNDPETKKQIIITKIRHWIQHHNGIEWDNTGSVNSYAVQRSADGVNWTTVHSQQSIVNSQLSIVNSPLSTVNYYNDPSPLSGNNYYRLQTTSVSGAVTNSNVIAVTSDNNTIKVSPNPAINSLHIEGLSSTQNLPTGRQAKLTVIDLSGNIKLQAVANGSVYNLNIASLTAGNYLLKIEMNGEVVTKQFVKE